ncbi:MAG: hypothetical protein HQL77_07210 [Magnetococcales bacterium]|nr:hypothetical protein [Magnetococcales bacterium]
MTKTSRKGTLPGLDEPNGASLFDVVRKYGVTVLVILGVVLLGSYFLGGSSSTKARKQTFIALEVPPPPPPPAPAAAPTTPGPANPPIPDDQE